MLVFSQYVETSYAAQLLAAGSAGVGYLLKDRVADVNEFVDALTRVAAAAPRSIRRWSPSCYKPAGEHGGLATLTRGSARSWP